MDFVYEFEHYTIPRVFPGWAVPWTVEPSTLASRAGRQRPDGRWFDPRGEIISQGSSEVKPDFTILGERCSFWFFWPGAMASGELLG
jgi:hypothetical protein